jgi:Uma2 family endonuclease
MSLWLNPTHENESPVASMRFAGLLFSEELLNGVLVWKMPKGPRHDASSLRCRHAIERILGVGWHLRVECAVRIPDYSEPEPDLSLVRGDLYARAGVPAYWIVNLAARQVEAHALPIGGAYSPATILAEDQSIELVLEGQVLGRILVADLLAKRA